LKTVVISIRNGMLSGAIYRYLKEVGELRPEQVESDRASSADKTAAALNADILLMEVTRTVPFDLESRIHIASSVRRKIPSCRIAVLCDETADPNLVQRIKEAKINGLIDCFFYSSVSCEYLEAVLETL
jgi:hypothetical protein